MIHNILPGNRIQRNQKLLNKFPESYLRYLARLCWRLPSSQRGIPTNNSDLPFFFSGGNGFTFKTGVLKGVCLISGRIFVGIFTVSIISPKAVLGLPPGKCPESSGHRRYLIKNRIFPGFLSQLFGAAVYFLNIFTVLNVISENCFHLFQSIFFFLCSFSWCSVQVTYP